MKLKFFKRSTLIVTSFILAISSLSAAVPLFLSQSANAIGFDVCASGCANTSIQSAIDAASAGATINVGLGTYSENVVVNKPISLIGEGSASTSIVATDANKTSLTFSTNGATVEGFTITHAYTATELANWNFNNNGVLFSQGTSNNTLKDSTVSLSRNGVYFNQSNGNITNDTITNNRTGINLTNNVNGTQITGNTISNNWTLGIVYYSQGYATNFSTVAVSGNSFNNWYTEVEVKTAGPSTGTLDVTNNTFSDSPVTYSTADASNTVINEPSFTAQKPNVPGIGGTATAPVLAIPTLRIYSSIGATLEYRIAPINVQFSKGTSVIPSGSVLNAAYGVNNIDLTWGTLSATYDQYRTQITYPNGSTNTPWTSTKNLWIGQTPYVNNLFGQKGDGTYTYSVSARSATTGLWTAWSTPASLTYDTIAPVVTVSPVAGSLLHGTETFNITVTDANLNAAANNIYVYLFNNGGTQKSQGAKVNLSSGHATFTVDTTKLNDGLTTLDVGRFADAAGNFTGPSDTYFRNYTIDNTAPGIVTLASPSNNAFQNINDFYFKWNALVGDTGSALHYEFQSSQSSSQTGGVLDTNVWKNTTSTSAEQNYLATPQIHSTGANGTWYWQARAVDVAGNVGPWSTVWTLNIDTSASAAPTNAQWLNSTTLAPLGAYTNQNPTIPAWTAPTSGTVSYYEYSYRSPTSGWSNWTPVGNVTNLGANSFYGTGNTGTQGEWQYRVRTVNDFGVASAETDSLTIIYDRTAPTVSIDAQTVENSSTQTITGMSDDNTATVTVVVNGASYTSLVTNGIWTVTTTSLSDGSYPVSATAKDLAGNVTDSAATSNIVVDTAIPTVTINTPFSPTSNTTPKITGTYNSNDNNSDTTVTLSIDGGTVPVTVTDNGNGTWSYTPATALSEGDHTFQATATDTATNHSQSNLVTVIVDTTGPALTIVQDATYTNKPTFTGTVGADAVSLTVTINGEALVVNRTDTTWSASVTSPLAVGDYTVTAIAKDASDNMTTVTAPVTVSTVTTPGTSNTPAVTTPLTTTGATTTANNLGTPAVLGTSTTNNASTPTTTGATDVKGASTQKPADTQSSWALAWYWWVLIVLAIAGFIWWLFARRRNQEA
jgi:hypothetical protein